MKIIPRTSISLKAMTGGDDLVKEMAEAMIQVSKSLFCRGIIQRYVTRGDHTLDVQMAHSLQIAIQVQTGASRPASDTGTKKRATCYLHSAPLPFLCIPSWFLVGQAQETQRESPARRCTKEGSSAKRVVCIIRFGLLFTVLSANEKLFEVRTLT